MPQQFYGSICITELLEQAKEKHSAFVKGTNGKIYANVSMWLNDDADKFGNIMSMKLSCTKDKIDTEGKVYVGNFKESETSKPISNQDIKSLDEIANDLPF